MTTIVIDKKRNKIFCDTQITTNNNTKFIDEKCIELTQNILFTYSGDYYYFKHFLKQLKSNIDELKSIKYKIDEIKIFLNKLINENIKNKLFHEDLESELIFLIKTHDNNNFLLIINDNDLKEKTDEYYCSGSGSDYAKTIIKTINKTISYTDLNEFKNISMEYYEKIEEIIILSCLKQISEIDIYTNNNIKVYKIKQNNYNDFLKNILKD